MSIILRPIGRIHTPFTTKEEAPIQGAFCPEALGVIEVFPEFSDGLIDIKGFSHLILLYELDRAKSVDLTPLPLLDDDRHGVFATRFPARPNGIGFTVVTLHRQDGNRLEVGMVDMLDGTPLLDIKPYLPRFDAFPNASEGWFTGLSNRQKPVGRE